MESITLPIDHMIPRYDDGISGYDAIGNIARHLFSNVPGWGYTELKAPNEEPNNGWEKYGTLAQFSQAEFIELVNPDQDSGM